MLENSPAHFLKVLTNNPAHSLEVWTIIQPTLSEHFLPQQLPAVLTCELLSILPIDFAIVYFLFPFPSKHISVSHYFTRKSRCCTASVTIRIRVIMNVSMNVIVAHFCTSTSASIWHCNCKGLDWIGGSIAELVGLPPLLANLARI